MPFPAPRKIFRIIFRSLAIALLAVAGLVVLAVIALYLPPVQKWATALAVREMEKATGMDIEIAALRLRPPLDLEVEGFSAVEASGDTLASLGHGRLDLMLLPLVSGSAELDRALITDLFYRLGTPDSAMYLTARVDSLSLDDASYSFSSSIIDARGPVALAGARIALAINDSVPTPPDTAASSPLDLIISARDIELRRVDFTMTMLPVIDTLSAFIPSARLADGRVDMARQDIHARSLSVDGITAAYIYPRAGQSDYSASPAPSDSSAVIASGPWTVTADHLTLTAASARYAMAGASPLPGLDMDYIEVADVEIAVDSLYNRATAVRVPLRRLLATERSGLSLNASGLFEMDSTAMRASDFSISTGRSIVTFDALMGMGDLTSDPGLPIELTAKAEISPADVATTFPLLEPLLTPVAPTPLRLVADLRGTSGRLTIDTLSAALPSIAHLRASGSVDRPFAPDDISGRISLDGAILAGADRLKSSFLDPATARSIHIEPTALRGSVTYSPGLVDGALAAVTDGGRLNLDARWAMKSEGYDATLSLDRFPIQAFMPSLGLADASADISLRGHGYNPMRRSTGINASLDLDRITLNGRELRDINLAALLSDGEATGSLTSSNHDAELDARFKASIEPAGYSWDLTGDIYNLDLRALGLASAPMGGALSLSSRGTSDAAFKAIDAILDISDLDFLVDAHRFEADSLRLALRADSATRASLRSGSLALDAASPLPLDALMGRLPALSPYIDTCIARRRVDIIALQQTLPPMDLTLVSGRGNILADYVKDLADASWSSLDMALSVDSLIRFNAGALGLMAGATPLDSLSLTANQKGKHLVFNAAVNQKPGTMDNFAHVNFSGFIADDRLSMLLHQSNLRGETGFNIGVNATATDSVISLAFVPRKPVIGYKRWAINPDNYVNVNFVERFISANVALQGDNSRLRLYTLNERQDGRQEDIVLALDSIHIQDWLAISPFAPPVRGDLGADLRFHLDKDRITGRGNASLTELYYGRERVGSFDLDLDIANSRSGALTADVALAVDSVRVITARGALNDSTARDPFLLDFSLIRFPLSVANPFLPREYARLSGSLSGHMDITGSAARPVFNGKIAFDSAACRVGMLGQSFSFASDSLPVDSGIVRFDRFRILAANNNPLLISGTIDARSIIDPAYDLTLSASDMQIINSSRPRGAEAYGKAFIDLDASIKGNMRYAAVKADLDILPGTNVTYIMTDARSRLESQSTGDMVRFVVLSDTGYIDRVDSIAPSLNLFLDADLTISEGSTIAVDLSADGKNRVQLQPQGTLSYSQNPMNDGRVTGRININQGFARYTPPLMSEKLFNFREGSYVAFNGDMMNPILNIHAYDEIRANVTRSGEDSRLVNFDVSLDVTGTLSQMNVGFDLASPDDITIQNELQGMSPDQRANQAMNLLLYNVYTGQGTHASANLSGNPLYAFLSSQLNSWMAQNIKGVDITFGIDQYDKTQGGYTSTATSYSYRISKNLFNDRFKIIVGGNYSTDADADENFSQNLINDISFEYLLNRSGSMYVRIFRHTGYESILEGEITQTGVGFVLKRKLNTLRNIFRFLPGVKPKDPPTPQNP